ncbi:MAG: DUF192 domain-containing protein [Candidatus Pacearchaeota archaeon]|nr:DUF192 domain-containing protein [Candidatus Pacearchaeota archaeon]
MRSIGFAILLAILLLFPMRTHYLMTAVINGTPLKLEVVSGRAEKIRGLSGREFLPENQGMLFVYEKETQPSFWMKDMGFSLDIIWISSEKKVVGVEVEVSPATYPAKFTPDTFVQWVLEVNAGWAEKHGVSAGDAVEF